MQRIIRQIAGTDTRGPGTGTSTLANLKSRLATILRFKFSIFKYYLLEIKDRYKWKVSS